MSNRARTSIEDDATTDSGAVDPADQVQTKKTVETLSFLDSVAKRSFSEGEVSQSITVRFLFEKIKEYEDTIASLRPYQVRSYELDRDLQVETSKNKKARAQEIISLLLTTIGGAGMGLAIKFSNNNNLSISIPAFCLFAGIVLAGVLLKVLGK